MDPIDPAHAPVPANDGEHLVFRQLYESLVRIDCERRVRPALAELWRADASGAWIVTLRAGARFADGTPVTAAEVLAGWTRGDVLEPRVSRYVESAAAVNDRVLAITLRGDAADAPFKLAYPDLAVTLRVTGLSWPIGTRDVMARETRDGQGRPVIALIAPQPIADAGSPAADTAAIRFVSAPAGAAAGRRAWDERDFLDAGVDLIVTRNPVTLEYAATLPEVASLPLPWNTTHVYVSPWVAESSLELPDEARHTLAADAVRGEARGAQSPFWWQAAGACTIQQRAAVSGVRPAAWRIVYDAGDAVARSLAERIVAIANAGSGRANAGRGDRSTILQGLLPAAPPATSWRATGLTGQPLVSAMRSGTDAAYVTRTRREPLDPCEALRDARSWMPWFEPAAVAGLVDTRLRAIVRLGRAGLELGAEGDLLIGNPRQEPVR
jgi:hypothetical protein